MHLFGDHDGVLSPILLTPASLRLSTLSSLRGKRVKRTGFIAVGFSQRITGRQHTPALAKIDNAVFG
jgi:hypothetical protein